MSGNRKRLRNKREKQQEKQANLVIKWIFFILLILAIAMMLFSKYIL